MRTYKGGGAVPENQTQTIINEPSAWQKKWTTPLMRGGTRMLSKPHRAYQGNRVAPMNPMETQAFRGVQSLYEAGERPELGYAFGQAQQAGATGADPGQWGGAAYQQYASPFQENVLSLGRERIMDEYARAVPGIRSLGQDQGFASGQLGGRARLEEVQMQRELADQAFKNVREYQAQGQQYGYEQALGAFQAQQAMEQSGARLQLEAAQESRALAEAQQQQALQRLAAMQEAGYSQREIDQAMRDIAYQDFIEKRDWRQTQLQMASDIIYGNPATRASNRTVQTDRSGGGRRGPGLGATIGGLGIAGLGAYGAYQNANP